jgi:hypothetical protein
VTGRGKGSAGREIARQAAFAAAAAVA